MRQHRQFVGLGGDLPGRLNRVDRTSQAVLVEDGLHLGRLQVVEETIRGDDDDVSFFHLVAVDDGVLWVVSVGPDLERTIEGMLLGTAPVGKFVGDSAMAVDDSLKNEVTRVTDIGSLKNSVRRKGGDDNGAASYFVHSSRCVTNELFGIVGVRRALDLE